MAESPPVDQELLRQLAQGNETAFRALYERYQGPLYRFALHMSGNSATAEEVTQEVFMLLIKNPQGYEPEKGSIAGYLFGTARNLTRRITQRSQRDLSMDEECDVEGAAFASNLDILAELSNAELLDVLRKAVLALPEQYREVVVLCDLEELSYADAAVLLECAPWDRSFKAASRSGHAANQTECSRMPEIDPQSESRVSESLRRMAAASPAGAPPEISAGLLTAFRRHHARRRLIRRVRVAALAACLIFAVFFWKRPAPHPPSASNAPSPVVPSKVPNEPVSVAVTAVPPRQAAKRVVMGKTPSHSAANRQFVALPAYDPGIPMDELRVVRVQLPASALWQMGAPLNSDVAERRMLADFIVGQDGTPYAMRLLQ